jgi:hypothetical protein
VKEAECSGNIMYSCMKMEKWDVETIPGMGGGGEGWKVWIQQWYIVRTFVNVTMYHQYNNSII